jgi:hypothetical protein
MRSLGDLSIRSKLTLMIMVASSSALFLACAAFISYDSYTFRIAKVEDVATVADIIGSNSEEVLTYQDANSAREGSQCLALEQANLRGCIYDRQSQISAKYQRDIQAAEFGPRPVPGDGNRFEDQRLMLFRKVMLT